MLVERAQKISLAIIFGDLFIMLGLVLTANFDVEIIAIYAIFDYSDMRVLFGDHYYCHFGDSNDFSM